MKFNHNLFLEAIKYPATVKFNLVFPFFFIFIWFCFLFVPFFFLSLFSKKYKKPN